MQRLAIRSIFAFGMLASILLAGCSAQAYHEPPGGLSLSKLPRDFCIQPVTRLEWNALTAPSPMEGLTLTQDYAGGEVRFLVELTSKCAGTITVGPARDGGRIAKAEPSCDHNLLSPADFAACQAKYGDGASFRLSINGVEVCRKNDGSKTPPAPGNWSTYDIFHEYNLSCTEESRNLAAGDRLRVEAFRWNENAESFQDPTVGFNLVVTFKRQ